MLFYRTNYCQQILVQFVVTLSPLIFNAKETLCIKFHHGHHVNEITQYTIFLGNDKLKCYSQVKHLGHTLNCCVKFSADVTYRKGQFIGCVNSIITQYGFPHPVCEIKLIVTHGYSFYDSSLWDLYDNDIKKLYITWNIVHRGVKQSDNHKISPHQHIYSNRNF